MLPKKRRVFLIMLWIKLTLRLKAIIGKISVGCWI